MSIIQTRLLGRIAASPHQITLVFPPAPPTVTSTPTNPFGPTPTTGAVTPAPTPRKAPLTVRCLWSDGLRAGDLEANAERMMRREQGWYTEATAVARVAIAGLAKDATNLYAGSWLDDAANVRFNGLLYEVVLYTPVSAGHLTPVTYSVWLKAAQQQPT